MKLHSVMGNAQRLDGGAMFGNCPKALWSRWCAVDDQNRIELACRALLVQEGQRNILFEAGIGAFFEPKLRERFGVRNPEHVLLQSLEAIGVSPESIDIIVLSHLHFDHAGGLLSAYQDGEPLKLVFPNAHYVVGKEAWERAKAPHPRDRASFIPELPALLEATGRLHIEAGETSTLLGEGYRFYRSHGHTPGLLLTRIETPQGPLTFMGDLVPGVAWVHLPITMGYDRYPELLIDEKTKILGEMQGEAGWAFFTHDPEIAAAKIVKNEKGRFGAEHAVSGTAGPLNLSA